jgi:acyl transferase domain-containing protein
MSHEAVAVVGLGCRFPGARGPAELWQLLLQGRDVVSVRPQYEWLPPRQGEIADAIKQAQSWPGGFLDRSDCANAAAVFAADAGASSIDPQQSLFRQCAAEAIAAAGLRPQELAPYAVGVFAGATNLDVHRWLYGDPAAVSVGTYLATAPSAIANRTSLDLDLRGPSLTVDTACSSAVVAIHLACQSLIGGETDFCLAGGVNIILTADSTLTFMAGRLLSPSGRCRVFSADADGYVRAEGCGVFVLTTLRRATAAGLPVRALILGSAVGHGGHGPGLMVPRAAAQEQVMARAWADAGISPDRIGYLEAHAVGTQVGDLIELKAIERVFKARHAEQKLLVGSLKTNFGHSEPASGAAGLLKAVFVAAERQVPPNLHFTRLNAHVRTAANILRVPTEQCGLPGDTPLVGVSAFGATGTNAHMVVAPPDYA